MVSELTVGVKVLLEYHPTNVLQYFTKELKTALYLLRTVACRQTASSRKTSARISYLIKIHFPVQRS